MEQLYLYNFNTDIKRLNIGCGKTILTNYINIDKYNYSGVDIVCDLNKEEIPFPNNFFDYILASHFLEHTVNVIDVVRKIHRVLKKGGILEIKVPYKINYEIGHFHYFKPSSINIFVDPDNRSLEHSRLFYLISTKIKYIVPFAYHIKKYLNIDLTGYRNIGLKRSEITWILKKI